MTATRKKDCLHANRRTLSDDRLVEYCENTAANAVLGIYQREAEASGIAYAVAAEIPQKAALSRSGACSPRSYRAAWVSLSNSSLKVSSTLLRTNSLICSLITSLFRYTIFSDTAYCLLSGWCVAAYQSSANHVSFYLFYFAKLILHYRQIKCVSSWDRLNSDSHTAAGDGFVETVPCCFFKNMKFD